MKILVVSEYHLLNTGYATYYKNILEGLHNAGHEVSELASFGNANIREHVYAAKKCPWSVYLNTPSQKDESRFKEYIEKKNSTNDAEFGSWDFESIVLECWPDVVIAIRDHWYDQFIVDSPLSRYYRTVLSPTVDSHPLRWTWLDTYKKVDVLTSYNQWSEDWLREQYGGSNIVEHIPMGPNPEYKPINQKSARAKLGLPEGGKILLTVMRNQGRKRFSELFEAFAQVRDKSISLYCHTHLHDMGWDIPKLLAQNEILDRVYFSYKCRNCWDISSDLIKVTPRCKKCGDIKEICSIDNGLTNEQMNYVYNSADLYVQWANSEGFGQPVIEAASTGLRVITVNYSAQEDIIRKIDGIAIDPIDLQREMGTLCYRALPDNKALAYLLNTEEVWNYDRAKILETVNKNYDWKFTGKKWVDLISKIEPKNNWEDSPTLLTPPSLQEIKHLSNFDFVKACILNVSQDKSLLGSYEHAEGLTRLEVGSYIEENIKTGRKERDQRAITREMVYEKFYNMLMRRIDCERRKNHSLNEKS